MALAVGMLAACAAPPVVSPEMERAAREPLVCRSSDECRVWWQRAQVWIATNSHWKIQTATDAIIETYGGSQYSTDRAYQVIREPQGNGMERISIRSGCRNRYACNPGELEAAARFKQYVRGP